MRDGIEHDEGKGYGKTGGNSQPGRLDEQRAEHVGGQIIRTAGFLRCFTFLFYCFYEHALCCTTSCYASRSCCPCQGSVVYVDI